MKQIFILEREEMNELKRGEALKIVFGDQTITLQADVPRRPSGLELSGRERATNSRRGPNGATTITSRVFDYLGTKGAASVIEIAEALGVERTSVSSPLLRGKGKIYKRTGKGQNTVWRTL